MKISVVSVCYNSECTIGAALRSVAQQDHGDIEQIVIDGGSTDRTLAEVDLAATAGVKVLSEPDAGIYDAMNKGIDRATGDVIAFLNSDDRYAAPWVLSRVVEVFAKHDVDAVFGDVAFFKPGAPDTAVRRYRSNRFTPAKLAWGLMPAHPACFMRREVYEKVGHFKTDYRIAGDYEFLARAFSTMSIKYRHLPEVLVHMQSGGASTAGFRSKMLLNAEVLRACRENGIRTNMAMILSKYPAKLLEMVFR